MNKTMDEKISKRLLNENIEKHLQREMEAKVPCKRSQKTRHKAAAAWQCLELQKSEVWQSRDGSGSDWAEP